MTERSKDGTDGAEPEGGKPTTRGGAIHEIITDEADRALLAAAKRAAEAAEARKRKGLDLIEQLDEAIEKHLGVRVRVQEVEAKTGSPYEWSCRRSVKVRAEYMGRVFQVGFVIDDLAVCEDGMVDTVARHVAHQLRDTFERYGFREFAREVEVVENHFVGFREWRLYQGRLLPMNNGSNPWRGSQWVEATCSPVGWEYDGDPRARIGVPHHGHHCGFNAWHEVKWMRHVEPPKVIGAMQAKGEIEVHWDGFRAQFARPIALVVPRDSPEAAALGPLGVARVETVEELIEFAMEFGQPVPTELRPEIPEEMARYAEYQRLGAQYKARLDFGKALLTPAANAKIVPWT